MDERLEEIQGKFDFLQESSDAGKRIVTNMMGTMNGRIKLGDPFEVFYDFICQYPILDTVGMILDTEGISPITEEDLKYLYKYIEES